MVMVNGNKNLIFNSVVTTFYEATYSYTHNQAVAVPYLTYPNVTDLTTVRVALIKPELRV